MGKTRESYFRYLVWTFLGVLIGCALLNLGAAIDSIDLVMAFDMDEGLSGIFLKKALAKHSLDPQGFFNYGFSYIAGPYFLVRGLQRLGYETPDYLLFYVGRSVSLACYGGAIAATYCTVRRAAVGRTLATLSAGVLAASTSVTTYAQIFRPDLPQMAAITLALLCLARPTATTLLLAFAFSGLGFGIKYSGAFMLVPIFVSYALGEIAGRPVFRGVLWRRIAFVIAGAVAFLAVWLITNPYVISQWGEFRGDIAFEQHHLARGHHQVERASPVDWFWVFGDDLSAPALVAIAFGVCAILVRAVLTMRRLRFPEGFRRALRSPRRRFLIAVAAYLVVGLAFLMVDVRMMRGRYWMHLLPATLVLAAVGLKWLLGRFSDRIRRAVLCAGCVLVAVLLGATASARSAVVNRIVDDRVRLGDWIAAHYPVSTRIMSDAYTYVGPQFRRVKTGKVPLRAAIVKEKPQIVIFSRFSAGASCWMRRGTKFARGEFDCKPHDGVDVVRETLLWIVTQDSGYEVKRDTFDSVLLVRGDNG